MNATPFSDQVVGDTVTIEARYQLDRLQGSIVYIPEGVRTIKGLTEMREARYQCPLEGKVFPVFVKFLCYATVVGSEARLKEENTQTISDQLIQWTSLKHPNILPFMGYQWDDVPSLIFPHFKNGNILEYLKVSPHIDRLELLAQIAEGLIFLHSESVIHGSVKPSNVIISDEGAAMLMDFGMAPDLRVAERHITRVLSDQELVGYMSPELVEEEVFTPASDVYSYGALVLHIMSGYPPFHKLSYEHVLREIEKGSKPSPSDHDAVPESSPLWDLMERCWSQDPESRLSMTDVCSLLDKIRKGKNSDRLFYVTSFCSRLVASWYKYSNKLLGLLKKSVALLWSPHN